MATKMVGVLQGGATKSPNPPSSPGDPARRATSSAPGAASATAATGAASPTDGALRPAEVLRRARANVEHIARDGDIRVFGEVSGPKRLPTGHLTFDLKDPRAKLPCIIFYNDTLRLKFDIEQGMELVVTGKPTVTEWSVVQMRVSRIDPVSNEGALEIAFRQMKAKLDEAGLFKPERKRALPLLPRTIGIVTSSTGAAIRDCLKVLFDRMPGMHVIVKPTKVQGDQAAAEVADAIRALDKSATCDVILVVRGGGSLEDLWAFNTEPVARAIAACRVPVVTGVGHETDTTIADLVADKRAATPSNAAEIAVPRRDELAHRVDAQRRRLAAALKHSVHDARVRVDKLRRRLVDPRTVLAKKRQRVRELEQRLERAMQKRRDAERTKLMRLEERLRSRSPERVLAVQHKRLAALEARLKPAVSARRERAGRVLAVLVARLEGVSPLVVLSRGYAIVRRRDDGHVVRDPADAPAGTRLDLVVDHGAIVKATVDDDER